MLSLNACNNEGKDSGTVLSEKGIASLFPGDKGMEEHPSVLFTENFESGTLIDLEERWGYISNKENQVIFFSRDTTPESMGSRSLQMTATRGQNYGGELYKTFDRGHDKVYLRFYTKFSRDHGNYHHFVALRGFANPLTYPSGGAGQRAENYFSVTIEPGTTNINSYPNVRHAPPGIWQFYAYWPEMRSWQSPEGVPDGDRPNPYYGNTFQPQESVTVPRDDWVCIEIMLKLNTSPEMSDGEMALWIDGEQVVHFAPGMPVGVWDADRFLNNPDHPDSKPFEGFRWRHDMDVSINVLRLQHYISDSSFEQSETYLVNHPDYPVNLEEATVWFDDIVMATEYIGPIQSDK